MAHCFAFTMFLSNMCPAGKDANIRKCHFGGDVSFCISYKNSKFLVLI